MKVYINKIIPVSVYQNKVYTQKLIVETGNGLKLALNDDGMHCDADSLGKLKEVDILIYTASFLKVDTCTIGIEQTVDEIASQGTSAQVCGIIEDIIIPTTENILDFPYAVLNVGTGTIKVFLDTKNVKLFKKNDYLLLDNARMDLRSINSSSSVIGQ